jgi:tetratricopeptide (TPR) repeat protein
MEQQAEQLTKPVQPGADQGTDVYELLAWFYSNRKQVITVLTVVAVVAAGIGIYVMQKNHREEVAAAALGDIRPPASMQDDALLTSAAPYLKVAENYAGTRAAERALILAGGILFDAGKFDDSRAAFDRFMSQYSSSPFAAQALLGVAASLEAQGKTADAAARYEDLVRHHGSDSSTVQAKSALARCYVALNKPEQALAIYEELTKAKGNDTWSSEAQIQAHELIVKFPNLVKPKTPALLPTASVPAVKPAATSAPAATTNK